MPTCLKNSSPKLHWPSPSPSPLPSSESPPSLSSESPPSPHPSPGRCRSYPPFAIQALVFAGGAEIIPHQTCTGHRHHHRRSPLWHPSPRRSHPFARPVEVGDEFVDFKASKGAKADRSINGEHKVTFRYQKSDKRETLWYAPMTTVASTVPSVCTQPRTRTVTW